MAQSAALDDLMLLEKAGTAARAGADLTVSVTHSLAEAEAAWRSLAAGTIESPGQSFDFIRLWVSALGIAERDQYFVTAFDADVPVALLPLQRRNVGGLRVLGWFPGAHVGCGAPIVDRARLAEMGPARRRRLWIDMLRRLPGADLVYLRSVPAEDGLFAELGQALHADTLYRAAFASFEEADSTQRNKSRRKHDRQQGDKLDAMGKVAFEELGNGVPALLALDTMFTQRAARFREMGVFDPFSAPNVRAFYDATVAADSGVPVKLHVLRLDGRIVAMRYSVAHGDRLFCLISSMSEDASLRPGSPGKQCLLRVMQTVYGEGFRVFDMGEGLTDEKRHWCNRQVEVRHHYVPITRRGALAAALHRRWQLTRAEIKSNPRLLEAAKSVRALVARLRSGTAPAAPAPGED